MSVGYLIGEAYSEAVQNTLNSSLEDKARVLVNDCLTGAWVADDVPLGVNQGAAAADALPGRPRRGDPHLPGAQRRHDSAEQARLATARSAKGSPRACRAPASDPRSADDTLAGMPEPVETLAAIDVGTNSFHLVVARVTWRGPLRGRDQREGDGPAGPRRRRHEAARRPRPSTAGIATLRRMKQIADIARCPCPRRRHQCGPRGREPRGVRRPCARARRASTSR